MATEVHIIPHMNWDREWYFTAEESKILLANNMEEIITRLENDPDYKYYILDGQNIILEDYFSIKPDNKNRFKKLVQQGKLIIGPWYTQVNTMLLSGESIIRNLLYGTRESLNYGSSMKIGYLPHSFGMSSQLPMIYNGFGIDKAIFSRGLSERHGTNKKEFIWKSNDGSKVFARITPPRASSKRFFPTEEDDLREYFNKLFKRADTFSVSDTVIISNGFSKSPVQENLPSIIQKLQKLYPEQKFEISNYENVFERIIKAKDSLDEIQGEFNDSKFSRIHRTISSTRMDLKIFHSETENKIINILEPLASLAWSLGFEYHHGIIVNIWKEIMKNQSCNSLSSCCSDRVHKEINGRFILADDMITSLIDNYTKKIAEQSPIRQNDDKILLFNLLPYERDELIKTTVILKSTSFNITNDKGELIPYYIKNITNIDPGQIDRNIVRDCDYVPFNKYEIEFEYKVPPMGYTTLFVTPNVSGGSVEHTEEAINYLENEFYKIDLNSNGTIDILDKINNKTYKEVLNVEESIDAGDEYNYSSSENDLVLYSKDTRVDLDNRDEMLRYQGNNKTHISVSSTPYQQSARISTFMDTPKDIDERSKKQASGYVKIEFIVTLEKNNPTINIDVKLDNQADNHRLRVLIPTEFQQQEVFADNQFGIIKRPIYDKALNYWKEEGWTEAPLSIYQMINFVGLTDENCGVSLFSNGLREFEIIKKNDLQNVIALTLLRGVDSLGKENLLTRPGRPSGIRMETPNSQVRGILKTSFGIRCFKGNEIQGLVSASAKEYTTPIISYNHLSHNEFKFTKLSQNLPYNYSLFSKEKISTVLSSLKKAEDRDDLIVRFFNPSTNIESDTLHSDKILKIHTTNLNENILKSCQDLNLDNFNSSQVKSFNLKIQK
ncbi:MAG: glycoside hydrolase family 38 C-terminal domain-containing protein [Psittacicella sp.]